MRVALAREARRPKRGGFSVIIFPETRFQTRKREKDKAGEKTSNINALIKMTSPVRAALRPPVAPGPRGASPVGSPRRKSRRGPPPLRRLEGGLSAAHTLSLYLLRLCQFMIVNPLPHKSGDTNLFWPPLNSKGGLNCRSRLRLFYFRRRVLRL